jgi:transcription elongation GreA/GreB family factor
LHRIWSTDWFNDPSKEAVRLRQAVEARLLELKRKSAAEAAGLKDLVHASPAVPREMPIQPDLLHVLPPREADAAVLPSANSVNLDVVEVGDTVQVIYLQGGRTAREVTLSKSRNAPELGIVHASEPLGMALLGAEKDDEIEVLVGGNIRLAKVGEIKKRGKDGVSQSSEGLQNLSFVSD